ncbi:MAG: hypothetical protein ACE5DZ_01810 [Mariprofundus sp.]
MTVCSACGVTTEDNRKKCHACVQEQVAGTWKRQIRIYTAAIITGSLLLAMAIYQARNLPHAEGLNGMPVYILDEAALGGLGLLGGLFGLALAVFFNIWHRKKAA